MKPNTNTLNFEALRRLVLELTKYVRLTKGAMELVDENTLASWLTHEIQKHEGCNRCEIVRVYKRPDAEGHECNWRVGVFVSHNPNQEACRQNLNHVRDSAAEQFKLA